MTVSLRQDNNTAERSPNHFAVETKQYILCVVVDLHVTVNQTLSVAQQCLYGKFMLPARQAMYV